MTKKQFENELKQQAYTAVPDKRDDLLKTVSTQSGRVVSLSDGGDEPHLVPVVPANQKKRWIALAACFAVVLVAVLIAGTRENATLPRSESTKTRAANSTGSAASGSAVSGASDVTGGFTSGTTVSGVTVGNTTASGSVSGMVSGSAFSSNGTTVTSANGMTVTSANGTTGGATNGKTNGRTEKKGSTGGATTATAKSAVTSTAKPTTTNSVTTDFGEKTTVPTTKNACSHQIIYKVPVMNGNGEPSVDRETCVQYGTNKGQSGPYGPAPTEPSESPTEQPAAPTRKNGGAFWAKFSTGNPTEEGECTFYIVYEAIQDIASGTYGVFAEVKFTDGWKITFHSVCEGGTVLYTNMRKTNDKGVCVEEQRYNPTTEILTVTYRNEKGETTSSYTKKVPKGSKSFAYMGVS